jgi:predicted nucleotidyltransferase
MIELIKDKQQEIIAACKKHHVEALSLFGSAASNRFGDDSDIDFLVQFSKDLEVIQYADNYFLLLDALQSILNKKVDLVSNKSIKNPVLREEIFQSKIDLYAA